MHDVPTTRFVSLLRVSTKSQGSDGLGIAAQRRDIQLFLNQQKNPDVIAEFVEVESGAANSRPVLEQALDMCRKHKSSLLVQKVDRITRDLEVLARIVKDPEVTVRVASLPNADNFQIHLFGCLAQLKNVSSYPRGPKQHWQQRKQEEWFSAIHESLKSTVIASVRHVALLISTQT